jgi:uncharacterized protein
MRDGGTPTRSVLLALSLFTALTSCAPGAGAAPGGVRSLAEFRHAKVVMQEWDLSCGAAAIATLLTYDLGHPVSERAAAEAMLGRNDPLKVRVQGGFSLLDLQEFAEAHGYEASGYGNLSVEDVLAMAPAIVPVRFNGYDHFVVLRGARGGEVLLADPAFGRRSMRISAFERAWDRRVAFVIEGSLDSSPPPESDPFAAAAPATPAQPRGATGTGEQVRRETDETARALEPPRESDPFDAAAPATLAQPQGATGTGERVGRRTDETTRALERALVRRGAIVLPPLAAELDLEVGYAYRESDGRRRDTVTPAVNLRVGLPWRTQAELRAPLVALDRQDGVGNTSGLGDLELGLTKHILHERGAVPEVLVTARWKMATGESGGRLPRGTGDQGLQAVLTLVKRDAPVVLVGSLYYVLNLPSGGVDRGDATGAIATALLAATPNVSLLLGLDVATFSETTVRGVSLPRSDRLSAIVNLGVARVLTRRLGASLTAGIGVTPAAPTFLLSLSLPLRL